MLALGVLLFWQFITSYIGMRWPGRAGGLLVSPALVIAFHGKMLEEVMHAHRVSEKDLYGALRAAQVWSISEVEVRCGRFRCPQKNAPGSKKGKVN